MIVIGFGHRSGHGKDTASKMLETHLRIKVRRLKIKKLSFADKLKDVSFQLYGWAGVKPAIHYENHREDRYKVLPALGMDVNSLWVKVGEALRNGVYHDTWLNYAMKHAHGVDVLLVPDVRHFNEADAIIDSGGRLYRITNPRVPNREGASIDDNLQDYTRWTREILNDAEIDKLNGTMNEISDQLIEELKLGTTV